MTKTKTVHEVVKDLIKTFNVQISDYPHASNYKPLDYKSIGFTYWVRGDGKKFKSLGEIYPYLYGMRDKYEFDWSLFEYVPKFWEWLKSLPGAKPIGKVSDWAEHSKPRDGILYRGVIFIYSGKKNSIIEFGSRGRFRNSSLWRIEKMDETSKISSQ
jgi:hypothetical protein